MKMKTVHNLHTEAMALAADAYVARQATGRTDHALTRRVMELEREAAMMVVAMAGNTEPTRSVLLRSAATLAAECGDVEEAHRLATIGLEGRPPVEIAEEIRDILSTTLKRGSS